MAKRKLTTIFCADAVQYGALMAADEDGTLARLQEYRDLMNEQFARFEGREINTWGDAIIAEFDSVVEAVRCAVEIQTALGSRNAMLPDATKLQFRIGINLGDVIHQGDNIYGDTRNMDTLRVKYARLNAKAEFQNLRKQSKTTAIRKNWKWASSALAPTPATKTLTEPLHLRTRLSPKI